MPVNLPIILICHHSQKLCGLCRKLEKLSPEQLQEKADELRKGAEKLEKGKEKLEQGKEKLEQGKEKLEQGKEKLEQGKEKVSGFFGWLKGIFQKLAETVRTLFRRPATEE